MKAIDEPRMLAISVQRAVLESKSAAPSAPSMRRSYGRPQGEERAARSGRPLWERS